MVCHKSERVHNVRFPFSGISSLTYLPIRSTEHLSYPHLRFNMSGVKLGFVGSEERELNILPKEKERERRGQEEEKVLRKSRGSKGSEAAAAR